MIQKLKHAWRRLAHGNPGRRFQQRYERRQLTGCSRAHRSLIVAAGVCTAALGLLLIPAPGPGAIVLVIGAGLIAEGSLPAARWLDRAELGLRKLMARAGRR